MKVTCPHCGERSRIYSNSKINGSHRELYCQCENSLCDARFVMTLAFKHDIRPPGPIMEKAVMELVRCLSSEDKKELLAMVTHPGVEPLP